VKRKLSPAASAQLKIATVWPSRIPGTQNATVDGSTICTDEDSVQQRLRHSDPRNLQLGTYTHFASSDDERIAMQLGEILDPDGPNKQKKTGVRRFG